MDRTAVGANSNAAQMDESDRASVAAYVRAAAALHGMPLSSEREPLVVAVVERLAAFAADVAAFTLPDEVEPAGVFTP